MGYDLPRNYLSASQVTKYLNCPKQYELEYVLNQRPERPRAVALGIGSTVHKMVELNLQSQIDGVFMEESEILKHESLSEMLVGCDYEGEDIDYWTTYSQILYKTWYKGVGNSIMPVKSEFGFDSLVGDVPVRGYVDYLDNSTGKMEICDLKVAKRSKSEADCRNSVQLAMYAIVENIPDVRFDTVCKTKIPKVGIARYSFAKSELDYFTDLIGEVATNISRGNFPMTSPDSWLCTTKWCAHFDKCRGKHAR
jgi:RecB family exonuclease